MTVEISQFPTQLHLLRGSGGLAGMFGWTMAMPVSTFDIISCLHAAPHSHFPHCVMSCEKNTDGHTKDKCAIAIRYKGDWQLFPGVSQDHSRAGFDGPL